MSGVSINVQDHCDEVASLSSEESSGTGRGGGVDVGRTAWSPQEQAGCKGDVSIGRRVPRVRGYRSRSVPERGRKGIPRDADEMVTLQSSDNMASLDLVRPHAGCNLKPCIPVQRTTAYTKKRRYGNDAHLPSDNSWLLNVAEITPSPQAAIVRITFRGVMREPSPTNTEVEPLLLSWFCVVLGVVSCALMSSDVKSMSQDDCLVMAWIYMGAVFFTIIVFSCAACCKSGSFMSREVSQDKLAPKTSSTLLALATLLTGVSSSLWFVAVRYVPRDSGTFFFTFQAAVVLVMKEVVGDGSTTGEKIGVTTTLLGAACFGLTDYIGEDKKSVTASELGKGIPLALASGVIFAISMIMAKFIRSHRGMVHTLPPLIIMYVCMMCFCTVITATVFPGGGAMSFSTNADTGLLGWTHIVPKWMLLTAYATTTVTCLLYSLQVLPTIVVSAIATLVPPLIFISDLVNQTADSSVPLPTQSVGALCVIAGCVCVCRSATRTLNGYIDTSHAEPSSQDRRGARSYKGDTYLPLPRTLVPPLINEAEPTPRHSSASDC
eukprot:TRINITY_DN5311_c0_g2_i1.p1 TRINITY_DN5311_c0_g2~~TRINITY_DN5311_c0_g2_i1.p1  ORF type:complete len:549 (+),score=56.14 TRINITY_DN5311_c0_g2_i1:972-2618(+)